MNEQFAPYEIAIKLKEKGFDNDCLAGYLLNRDGIASLMGCGALRFDTDGFINPYSEILPAPLWQQAFVWCLRKLEEKNPEPYNRNWCYGLSIDGSCFLDFGHGDYYKDFKTKEEAIEHALTLI